LFYPVTPQAGLVTKKTYETNLIVVSRAINVTGVKRTGVGFSEYISERQLQTYKFSLAEKKTIYLSFSLYLI
jgi:hypothetical protein